MNHFCTLFDSGYLTRGLALYDSLEKTGEPFRLYIICFDSLAHEILTSLGLENAVLIRLEEFESPELLSVKPGRTRGEYCWTCSSHSIRYVLERFGLDEVTYIDADLYFFAKPSLLLDELRAAGGSILLTEHRYAPRYDHGATSGKYCVQFMTFKKDDRGLAALQWWQDRCIEWCFNRIEDGKFGDQKYLDDWTTRFKGVHVLQHPGGGVAPWNVSRYEVGAGPTVGSHPVVFYHFHALKWFTDGHIDLAENYDLPAGALEHIYSRYVEALKHALRRVQAIQPGFQRGKVERTCGIRRQLSDIKRRLKGNYHVVSE